MLMESASGGNMENKSNETYLLLSGMKVINEHGTFYFSEPGNWVDYAGRPVHHKLHREDGPAVMYNNTGIILFYRYGKLHCETGPAVYHEDGTTQWYHNGWPVDPWTKYQPTHTT